MDHKQEHHEHHRKERDREVGRKRQHEHQDEKKLRVIHPLWLLVLGIALIILVIVAWSLSPFGG